jgi:5'-nucleotidase
VHFLLTNDDGIDAPGIAALEAGVRLLPGAQVTVVAPETERSLCGHRLTTHEPLVVKPRGEARYAISGTPADCVRVALFGLGINPDFVLSGVNAGGNMGQDLPVSGTIAGVREAAYHGLPGIAFSHYLIRGLMVDWDRTALWTAAVLQELLPLTFSDGEFWSVNFPHLPLGEAVMPERVAAPACRLPLNVSFARSEDASGATLLLLDAPYSERPYEPDSDVDVCFGGRIALTRLSIR